ncbi:MAG: serine/threonine-protein phosphatase [Desulfobacterales bacterium]|nr:serine/threonine-protein phosphatase [Desulfobacterales bacterium]
MENRDRIQIDAESRSMRFTGVSDCGFRRERNEDSIYLDKSGTMALLADGMGGHEKGAEASLTTVETIGPFLDPESIQSELLDITDGGGIPPSVSCVMSLIDSAVIKANDVVYGRNCQEKLQRFMGTTLVGLVITEGKYIIRFHVGDSRMYRLRDSKLEQLTKDHSAHVAWEDGGRQGAEPSMNVITRAIGPTPAVSPTVDWDECRPDDTYLMCSDGLSDMISDDHILRILNSAKEIGSIANALADAANAAGGKDNISVIVCKT